MCPLGAFFLQGILGRPKVVGNSHGKAAVQMLLFFLYPSRNLADWSCHYTAEFGGISAPFILKTEKQMNFFMLR